MKILSEKHVLVPIASAVMLLSACSSETEFTQEDIRQAQEQAQDEAVGFDVYIGNQKTTRALTNGGSTGVITTESMKTGSNNEGFGVFAYLVNSYAGTTAPNFMFNEQVKWSGTNGMWEYSPIKYWPNGKDAANGSANPSYTAAEENAQELNFFAYAPYVSTVSTTGITQLPTNNTATRPVIGYKISSTPSAPASVVDLLWGLRGQASYSETDNTASTGTVGTDYNTGLTKQNTTERVKFLFKHALAKIGGNNGLKIVYDIDGNGNVSGGFGTTDGNTLVTVKSITIKDALSGGTSTLYASGNFDISRGTWSDWVKSTATTQTTLMSLSYTTENSLNTTIAEPYDFTNSQDQAPSYSSSSWSPTGVTTTLSDVCGSATSNPIFMIPGTGSAGQTLEVEVEYVVRTYDAGLDASVASNNEGKWTKVTQKIKNNVSLPALGVNKYYTLVIHLGLTSVKFSAEVANWDAADGSDTQEVWLPSNVISETTSTTLAAGSDVTVASTASTTSYTINLTGLTEGNQVYCSAVSGSGIASTTSVSLSPTTITTAGTSAATVTLTPNASTTASVSNVVTIIEYTDANSNNSYDEGIDTKVSTTTVRIVQSKATS